MNPDERSDGTLAGHPFQGADREMPTGAGSESDRPKTLADGFDNLGIGEYFLRGPDDQVPELDERTSTVRVK